MQFTGILLVHATSAATRNGATSSSPSPQEDKLTSMRYDERPDVDEAIEGEAPRAVAIVGFALG